eukprot:SAG31_NODE_161_length_21899_cov_16.832844_1_plen_88_part_10
MPPRAELSRELSYRPRQTNLISTQLMAGMALAPAAGAVPRGGRQLSATVRRRQRGGLGRGARPSSSQPSGRRSISRKTAGRARGGRSA